MKMIGYLRSGLVLSLALFIAVFSPSFAQASAVGSQGYAVYRDGVVEFFGWYVDWHAGMMVEPNSAYGNPLVHSPKAGHDVQYGSWADFMAANNNFMGVYGPLAYTTPAERNTVLSMARLLRTEDISYTVSRQLYYSYVPDYIEPENITDLRCDGVVEYCYEYYGIQIYGTGSTWDVSRLSGVEYHTGHHISPESQAQDWMAFISSTTNI